MVAQNATPTSPLSFIEPHALINFSIFIALNY